MHDEDGILSPRGGLRKSNETNDNKNLNSSPRIKAFIDLYRSLYSRTPPSRMKFYSINESKRATSFIVQGDPNERARIRQWDIINIDSSLMHRSFMHRLI